MLFIQYVFPFRNKCATYILFKFALLKLFLNKQPNAIWNEINYKYSIALFKHVDPVIDAV